VTVLIVANLIATGVRFLMLRVWVFRSWRADEHGGDQV
jgi:hypothetical protein